MLKTVILSVLGAIGSGIAYCIGGFDGAVITLLIFMLIDYVTGLIVGGIFHKSPKTSTGALESKAGWKGLFKKFVTFLIVIVGNLLDKQLGASYIRDAVCIAFIVNETLSIIENAGLMGVPIPSVITKAIHILNDKEV